MTLSPLFLLAMKLSEVQKCRNLGTATRNLFAAFEFKRKYRHAQQREDIFSSLHRLPSPQKKIKKAPDFEQKSKAESWMCIVVTKGHKRLQRTRRKWHPKQEGQPTHCERSRIGVQGYVLQFLSSSASCKSPLVSKFTIECRADVWQTYDLHQVLSLAN